MRQSFSSVRPETAEQPALRPRGPVVERIARGRELMMKLIRPAGVGVSALAVLCAASGTTASAQATASSPTAALARPAAGQLTAQIRYTTGGVPHIPPRNSAGPGFRDGHPFPQAH